MDGSRSIRFEGRVTARTCPACGHHEVGITTGDGRFVPLKPGMRIGFLEEAPGAAAPVEGTVSSAEETPEGPDMSTPPRAWVPDPVKNYQRLRLKYGVSLVEWPESEMMTGEAYEALYLEKIRGLAAGEADIPIAVVLDRYFTAPHLASGSPLQIAHAMWRELEEVREPVKRVKEWLSNRGGAAARALIGASPPPESPCGPADQENIARELQGLTLEKFLELL